MKLQVLRFSDSKDSTNGLLFEIDKTGDKKFLCYTLEDERRDKKVAGETRIPEGTYEIQIRSTGGYHNRYSERFSDFHIGMLHIIGVPDFDYILIHCGNTDEDTAGCLLLGDSQENNKVKKNGFVGKSTQAYERIYPQIALALKSGECVEIDYKDITKYLLV
tara:strand:+ start:6912 stop:7397 length:486 start_codon:yes stop_codon:yes gene_type:complete